MIKNCDKCGYKKDQWNMCRDLKEDVNNCPEFYQKQAEETVRKVEAAHNDAEKSTLQFP